MIRLESVSVTYHEAERPTIRGVDLTIDEGELVLVVGPTGVGKSTLLGTLNGLVPHFTGGTLHGRVTVNGRDTATHPPRELAEIIGVVGQDPLAGFVTDTVEEELAYGMEQLAVPPHVMRKRVEETLDLLGIAELRNRPLRALSGGQQQRVAIGAVLTAHPRIIVLDEPTSALDPTAAEDVLATVTRLVHDLGVTVIMAEHRLERVVHAADKVISLVGDGTVEFDTPSEIFARSAVAPPVVQLGRVAGWSPLPMSVRDARRLAEPLRERLAGAGPDRPTRPVGPASTPPTLVAEGVSVMYGTTVAVREVDVTLRRGEVVALMGRNGSGKSSLLWALQGAGPRSSGSVTIHDGETTLDPAAVSRSEARRHIGMVPQTPGDLLYLDTVGAELAQADRDGGAPPGTCSALLDRLVSGIDRARHPKDLSEGQRLSVVLAVQLTASPDIVLLDEPTRGLDYNAKAHLTTVLGELARDGHTVFVSTHDVEFVAATAQRVIVMAQGEIVADGQTADVIVSSPAFAPQVAKVLFPQAWLTVAEVEAVIR
ncbi:MAG: energy-coupling factor ABC transporter ATP-binding protein [Actinobacteria bacterium]|nr:energy-coupling factor ABC transporter ATP-binding protein [Actinomycetota bacterium]